MLFNSNLQYIYIVCKSATYNNTVDPSFTLSHP